MNGRVTRLAGRPLSLVMLTLVVTLWLHSASAADVEALEAVQDLLGDPTVSPLPVGWTAGVAGYTGVSPWAAASTHASAFPGAIYIDRRYMYLGDRGSATLYDNGTARVYARGRLRFNSLDPADRPAWAGLEARRWEVEGGFGGQLVTPAGVLTLRGGSDLIGRSRGQDAVLSLDVPVLRPGWAVMASFAAVWRSSNLANYYYGGVSRREASSLHPYYDVGAVLSPQVALIASYRINRRWIAAFITDYEHYPSRIRDSPLVGRSGTWDAIAGVGYNF